MRMRVLLLITLVAVTLGNAFLTPNVALADPETRSCKWPISWWPLEVNYHIATGGSSGFTSSEATRVSYGGNVWSEAHFNLSFERVDHLWQATNNSRVYKGVVYDPWISIAEAYVYDTADEINPYCNADAGNPIRRVNTAFDMTNNFHEDCAAVAPFCENNGYYDLHTVSAHEFGHWFAMGHSAVSTHTMYFDIDPGDTFMRTLATGDRRSAHIMYGCAPTYTWIAHPHYACS